jgi:hypothetical protein
MFFTNEQDERSVVADKTKVRVPLMLMDGAGPSAQDKALYAGLAAQPGHKPGFIPWSDAQAKRIAEIREAHDARLATAWRDPPEQELDAQGMPERHDAPVTDTSVSAAYARRDRELSERWRNPG